MVRGMSVAWGMLAVVGALALLAVNARAAESKKDSKSKSKGKHAVIVMETTKGVIEITLYPEDAPKHSANFEKLVNDKFYDGIVFHRVEPGFVVQGGDPVTKKDANDPSAGTHDAKDGSGKEYKVDAEIKRSHKRGTVAMARLPEKDQLGRPVNPERKSSASQFYICLADGSAANLNGGYSAFGEVTKGMDIVDKIQKGDKIKKATVKK